MCYICKICKKEFNTNASLVSHLSNPRNSCKINIKDYYDKYLRKENEGICQFCGRETLFQGIVKGYPGITCKHCKNKNQKTQELRKKTYADKRKIRELEKEKKKIESGYYELPVECEICKEKGVIYKCKSRNNLARHISLSHKEVKQKDYYDKHFKTDPNEGICPITGKETTFSNLNEGYKKYFGRGTNSSDIEIQEKKKETTLKNYGVEFPCDVKIEQRISNYKNTVNKRIDLKNERLKLISILKKMTIDKTNKLQCQICGEIFNNYRSVGAHVQKTYRLTVQQYYDKFFKLPEEGICPISGLNTSFDCLKRGYYTYHFSVLTKTAEIINGNKNAQLNYIKNKIKIDQYKYNVELIDLDKLNLIGNITNIKCLKCGYVYKNRFTNIIMGYGKCPVCYPRSNTTSLAESKILENIKQHLSTKEIIFTNYKGLIKNPKTGLGLELDIYFPNRKFAIEFNGLYWHSEEVQGKDAQSKHLIKWNECKKNNVQLFQIFEDEWNEKSDIILSMIRHKLLIKSNKTIYARKCIIREITSNEKNIFLNNNHIQGKDSTRIKLGAFFEDELIAVMTFGLGNITRGGKPDQTKKWELSRFATKKEYSVVGVGGKLLEYFKRNFDWEEIYSYADLRFSNGNLYKKLGFELVSQTQPNYSYVKNGKRIHRYNLRKLPHEPIDIPEWKLRRDQGYVRIWDCGNLKFSLKK
jgi:hypothetical protein